MLISRRETVLAMCACPFASRQETAAASDHTNIHFLGDAILRVGKSFFGAGVPDFESAGEAATRRWGLPNSYILGQESAGDFRDYHWEGDGIMFNPDYSDSRLYWRSSTNKFGARAESQRTMILIYGRLNSGNAAFSFDDDLFEPPALIGGILVAASRARQTLIVTLRPILANLAAPRRGHISFTTHSTQIGTDYNGVQLTA